MSDLKAAELKRIRVLEQLQIVDTPEEDIYEETVALAAEICGVPVGLVTFIDRERQWFKARVGTEIGEMPRSLSFCTQVIDTGDLMVIENLAADPRFADHPFVTGEIHARFYAGAPIYAENVPVGTLCVLDRETHVLSDGQIHALRVLSKQISKNLELRLKVQLIDQRDRQLEEALARSQEMSAMYNFAAKRFEGLFYGLPVPCCTLDLEGQVMEWNSHCEATFGYSAGEVLFKNAFELLTPNGLVEANTMLGQIIQSGGNMPGQEWLCRRKNGESVWVLASTLPLTGPDGGLLGIIWSSLDITSRKEAEARIVESHHMIEDQMIALEQAKGNLESMAYTDAMTGLYNRRASMDIIGKVFSQSRRSATAASVIMLDVDHFKAFNDEFGHPEGDLVLMQVAKILSDNVRKSDFVCRYGGEEFIIVLPGTHPKDAFLVAQALREAIYVAAWEKRQVSASFGVAGLDSSHESADELVRDADEALYESKHLGRNRVSLAQQAHKAA